MGGYHTPIEISREVGRAEAEDALKILNWFFDGRPDMYLIQRPRVVYDSEGNQKEPTVRYYMKQKEQDPVPAADADPSEGKESNQNEEHTVRFEQSPV